jgi:hypothetical protein
MIDAIAAVNAYLTQHPLITGMPVAGIYNNELAIGADVTMPAKVVVIKPHGAASDPAPLYINEPYLAIQCFGETAHLAFMVEETVFLALKGLTPSVWASTYIHSVIRLSGPVPGRDVTDQWPFSTARFRVLASDLTIT